jgi:transposase
MKRGTRIQVPTKSQHRTRLNLFGWVEPLRGWYGFLPILKGNREGFLKFLQALHRRFQGWRIYLYVDKPKWHEGPEIDSFLADHPHFDLEYLPSYHPALNLVDRLWKQLRYEATTDHYFETIADILHAIRRQQRYWRPQKIISLCKVT